MADRIVKIGVAGYKSAMSPIAVNLRDATPESWRSTDRW